MKRLLLTIIICFIQATAFSQELPSFLLSKHFVYGVGISANQEEADNYALIALSKAIRVTVKSSQTYTISSNVKSSTSETYKKESNVSSELLLKEASLYLSYDGDKYTAYRYINKEEYISTRLLEYKKWMETANSYFADDSSTVKHVDNLVLGAYYMAYKSVDDIILSEIFQLAETYKETALDGARKIYGYPLFSGSYPSLYAKESWGIVASAPNMHLGYDLPGIEIELSNGTWIEPFSVSETDNFAVTYRSQYQIGRPTLYAAFSMDGKNRDRQTLPFRYTYEVYKDGAISKLNVEDEWYFKKVYIY